MQKIKITIATLCLVVFLGFCLLVFRKSSAQNVDDFTNTYASLPADVLEKNLEAIKKRISLGQYHLYKAYIARKKKDYAQSNAELKLAEDSSQHVDNKFLITEIYANELFNALLMKDPTAFEEALNKAKVSSPKQGWVQFFLAVQDIQKDDCAKALKVLRSSEERVFLSPWMGIDFSGYFSQDWVNLKIAECMIKEGKLNAARDLLKGLSEAYTGAQQEEVEFLIGKTYLLEAEKNTPETAIPYFKEAFVEFNRIPFANKEYDAIRRQALSSLEDKAKDLVTSNQLSNLVFYLSLLQQYDAKNELNQMAARIGNFFNRQIVTRNWQALGENANTLNKRFPEGKMREALGLVLEKQLIEGMKDEDPEQMDWNIRISRLFSASSSAFSEHVAVELERIIIDNQESDNETMERSKLYARLFDHLEIPAKTINAISEGILHAGVEAWNEGTQMKGIGLMEIALSISSSEQRQVIENKIKLALLDLYQRAYDNNKLEQLPYFIRALTLLKLKDIKIETKEGVEVALAAARALYKARKYRKAAVKAEWALMLDPDNLEARQLAAQTLYNCAEYTSALRVMDNLKTLNPKEIEALSVSLAMTDHPVEALEPLNFLLEAPAFQHQTLLNLAFGSIILGKPQSALAWFQQMQANDDEVLIGRLYAASQLGQWLDVEKLYTQLPEKWRANAMIKGLYAGAEEKLGHAEEAQSILNEIVASPPLVLEDAFSIPFSEFLIEKFFPYNPYSVVGLYYQNIVGDMLKALDSYKHVEHPTIEEQLNVALAESALGRYKDALTTLQQTLKRAADASVDNDLRAKVVGHVAEFYSRCHYFPEAVDYYHMYFTFDVSDGIDRTNFAQALMGMRRYDLAQEQWEKLHQEDALSLSEVIYLIDCLVHMDQFSAANDLAVKLLNDNPQISAYERIRLARLMLITNKESLVKTLVSNIKIDENDMQAMIEWIYFCMDSGDFKHEQEIVDLNGKALEKSVKGLIALSKTSYRAMQPEKGLEYLLQAQKMEPWNPEVTVEILWRIGANKEMLATYEKEWKDSGESATPALVYAYALIDHGLQKQMAKDENVAEDNHLDIAHEILTALLKRNKSIPRAYILLGMNLFFKGDFEASNRFFLQALQLDRSNTDAYHYLAMIDAQDDRQNEAVALIQKALTFSPFDPNLWEQLAFLYQRESNILDIQVALRKVVVYAPRRMNAYLELAKVEKELQDLEDSKKVLEEILKLDPKNIQSLKLLLEILHDPTFSNDEDRASEILNERQAIYERLHALDPKAAEAIESEFSQQ